jgi:hypothetical protein
LLPSLSTLHFAVVDVAITFTFLPLTTLHFALVDVTNTLTYLHGVVAIVVWLRFSTAITMPSFQGSNYSILLWIGVADP